MTDHEAGRALDGLIAEKVMGHLPSFRLRPVASPIRGNTVLTVGCYDVFDANGVLVPYYSTDIAAAWQVVEKLQKDGWLPDIVSTFRDRCPGWDVEMHHSESEESGAEFEVSADTAPLAICRAALKAVE